MALACVVEEDGQRRRFGPGDFPLAVGGSGADIVVPGLAADEVAAFLALDEGELFAQPQGAVRLTLGGQPITASQWLRDGDEVRLLGTRIRVVWRDGERALQVRHLPAARSAAPLELVAPPSGFRPASPAPILVRPAEYHPPAAPFFASGPRRRRLPSLRLVLPALAALLCAAYLFMARRVEVRVEPEPERLSVRGLPHAAWGGTRLLLPGRYTVRAERAGYRPLEQPLVVTGEWHQSPRFTLERLPGRVVFEVSPAAGVRVQVDGTERGTTPLAPVEIAAGEHEVALRAEGYQAFTTRVSVAGGGEEQTVRATLIEDRARVAFSSEPAGAAVSVDGAEIGRTPLGADLSSGERAVTVALAGHRTASRSIRVVAGQPLTVPVFRLEPLPGRLRVESAPSGAALSVDGQFRGETPIELTVSPRQEHALRLTKAGHDPAQASVRLDLDEARSLSLVLAPRLGEVEVTAEPADAEVVVDGEVKGRAGQTLRLTAAPHQIEVRRSGYEPHRVTVTPRPGFPQTVKARLRSLDAPRPVGPARITAQGHELRLLAPGRVQLGASRREPGRRANETLREVELQRPVYVSVREVTNAEFRRFQAAHASGRFGAHDLDGDAQPVVRVTWEEAAEYCNWLSTREGLRPVYESRGGKLVASLPIGNGYRLPTEAEWSRAARAADAGALKFPWGPSLPAPARSGNYADESARPVTAVVLQGYDDGYPVSSPVGSFRPNGLGFFDLGGNVAEWVHDVYSIPSAETPPPRDPTGPAEGDLHVIMGSSFLHGTVTELRLSYRDYATKARADVGFRVARYAEPAKTEPEKTE
jgi:formylglycine-generating enzyme required for sulfatase activity